MGEAAPGRGIVHQRDNLRTTLRPSDVANDRPDVVDQALLLARDDLGT